MKGVLFKKSWFSVWNQKSHGLFPGSGVSSGEDQLTQELFVLFLETSILLIKKDMQL